MCIYRGWEREGHCAVFVGYNSSHAMEQAREAQVCVSLSASESDSASVDCGRRKTAEQKEWWHVCVWVCQVSVRVYD
jgi:hypothetical protein